MTIWPGECLLYNREFKDLTQDGLLWSQPIIQLLNYMIFKGTTNKPFIYIVTGISEYDIV